MCRSMSFLLAGNWDLATIFLLSAFAKINRVYKIEGVPEGTYDKIWIYQAHSFIGLFNGIHQPLDPYNNPWPAGSGASKYAGKPVCGGHFRGCVFLLAHDREYAANELGCPHWQANECCLWCPADRNRFNVRSVGPHAPWKAHLYPPGPADRLVSNHLVWTIPGVTRFSHPGDLMHGGDQGVVPQMHASTMKHMVRVDGPYVGPTEEVRVQKLWVGVLQKYHDIGITKRLQTFNVVMIDGTDTYPCLKAKAAEARHLIKPILKLLTDNACDDNVSKHLVRAYGHLDNAYTTVMTAGLVPTTE